MREELLTSKQKAIVEATERALKESVTADSDDEEPNEAEATQAEEPGKDPPKRQSKEKKRTVKQIVEAEIREVLKENVKEESKHDFYFAYRDEKNRIKTLDNLISMKTTKLSISDLSKLYNDEEKEIIRIFKRKDKFNCLLVGDQVQLNDVVTKIQLKMEDKKDHYRIGKYRVFYLDANVFKKAIETTSVYSMVDALKTYFEGMKVLLVINNFDIFVDSRTSQDQINSQIAAKMLELFQASNFRILATIDEKSSAASCYGSKVIESNFYIKHLPETKYVQFREFIAPSIKRILNSDSSIDKEGMEKLRTYAGLYEYSNKFGQAYRLIEDAAIIAKEHRRKRITAQDFNEVYAEQFRTVKGYSKSLRHKIAIHEAGHYVLYNYLKNVKKFKLFNVVTVTILPIEDDSLGFNQLNADDPMLIDKKSADADVLISLGGRAAEELFCKSMSDGCYGDLQSAVATVQESLKYAVYDDNKFRFVSMISADLINELVLTPDENKELHKEITDKINALYEEAKRILKENADQVKTLAAALEEYMILSKAEIQACLAVKEKPVENVADEVKVENSEKTTQVKENEESN